MLLNSNAKSANYTLALCCLFPPFVNKYSNSTMFYLNSAIIYLKKPNCGAKNSM